MAHESVTINKDEIPYWSWVYGQLDYILRPHGQKSIYKWIRGWKESNPRDFGPLVVNSHRRLGKSYLAAAICIERCLALPDQEVRLIAPTDKDCEKISRPQIDLILRRCPNHLYPHQSGNKYVFKNPMWNKDAYSTLYLEGSEHKKGNRQRGVASDIVVLDEFRDMEDPDYLIDDIIRFHFAQRHKPLLLIISTPPATMDHPMVRRFIPESMAKGGYKCIPITENPDFSEEDRRALLQNGDENSIWWRREALCELIPDPRGLIIPEFAELQHLENTQPAYSVVVVQSYKRPPFYFPRVCIDFGNKDYTAALYYYVDWRAQLLVIEDEVWINRSNTRKLRDVIMGKAAEVFPNPPHSILYEADMTPQLQMDMAELLNFIILPVDKTEKAASIIALRDTVRQKKIRIVAPKCTRLLYQLANGTYSESNPKEFVRKVDDPDMGHCDALAALIYGHRRAMWRSNPYPVEGFTVGTGEHSIFIPTEDTGINTLEVLEQHEYMIGS